VSFARPAATADRNVSIQGIAQLLNAKADMTVSRAISCVMVVHGILATVVLVTALVGYMQQHLGYLSDRLW
jgi:hypothetical protein